MSEQVETPITPKMLRNWIATGVAVFTIATSVIVYANGISTRVTILETKNASDTKTNDAFRSKVEAGIDEINRKIDELRRNPPKATP